MRWWIWVLWSVDVSPSVLIFVFVVYSVKRYKGPAWLIIKVSIPCRWGTTGEVRSMIFGPAGRRTSAAPTVVTPPMTSPVSRHISVYTPESCPSLALSVLSAPPSLRAWGDTFTPTARTNHTPVISVRIVIQRSWTWQNISGFNTELMLLKEIPTKFYWCVRAVISANYFFMCMILLDERISKKSLL